MSKGCVNLCRKYFAVHKYIPYLQCCQLELCKLFTSESNESHDLYKCHNVDKVFTNLPEHLISNFVYSIDHFKLLIFAYSTFKMPNRRILKKFEKSLGPIVPSLSTKYAIWDNTIKSSNYSSKIPSAIIFWIFKCKKLKYFIKFYIQFQIFARLWYFGKHETSKYVKQFLQ